MKLQALLKKYSNQLTGLSALLILIAYSGKYLLNSYFLWAFALLLATFIGLVPIAFQALQALKFKQVSIELLVSIAVIAALFIQEYEESAIVTFLFAFGAFLEKKTLEKTRSSIKSLTEITPSTALRISGEVIDIDDVKINDELLVKTGAQIPVDGSIYEGAGFVNESSISGESAEIKKGVGDKVFAGTLLENGSLLIQAEKVGEDTTFGKIIELVEEAQDTKSSAEKFIDRFAKYYTPSVLVLSFLIFIVSQDIKLAITLLVLGCPGALVIGPPVSNVAGIGNGAKKGILIKGGNIMTNFSQTDLLLFDKTGTLTKGKTQVSITKNYGASTELINQVAMLESQSDHPLAKAIIDEIGEFTKVPLQNIEVIKGQGISADHLLIGNEKLLENHQIFLNAQQKNDLMKLQKHGLSTVLIADDKVRLLYGITDEIRPNVKETLTRLEKQGIKELIMLTGDNESTAQSIAQQVGISQVYANLLPEDKAKIVQDYKLAGKKVAFIGDGINDSPSIALADVGIAMSSGTDIAIETSDIVLMSSNFDNLSYAHSLAKSTRKNMRQNILIALFVVIFLLSGLILGNSSGFIGQYVNMATGMFVHEASILLVILNAMRLIPHKKILSKNFTVAND
ncbi:heavy metal translocating P-type ATPase [Lactococcus lactis subsp. lactis]|uniref:heavy metal translocating P-type ATPase n=1 Tax=Lactococcus lactis TaxID=1358 RepID=UPI001BA8D99A|nr:heavy metal translocating P-type ATPase [Lactococcus lactis]MDT3325978.1 heavy metal translocating P-type ATPase [Bacillota bacterium]MBR8679742.1 heavy metal translocating P-type ATPase [Lactococcus lactis subsp. lactis]MBR8682070.1 heavy metal translocating P-type ATPase [Lactococcus lactis subsp. lactis]MBR8687194.1 heavy metal translocating P-type ATPase [Lactococcus lactis subsp. lactis]MBS3730163.1 heavy metal translocating P-type ATPase [Lactococcus lactis subsp. lactis]